MGDAAALGAASAATEHSAESQLAELLSQEAGQTGEYELKVLRSGIVDYTYLWQGRQIQTQKLVVLLQSHIAEQYCLGVAKLQKKDKAELLAMQSRFQVPTVWKFTQVGLMDEKTSFVHTACRVAIDLRKTKATPLLQSALFPSLPTPVTTIADILQLRQTQRFDLMAIPAAIIAERRAGTGLNIADVRLIDGSKDTRRTATEHANATAPVTLFFKTDAAFASFKQHVGRSPFLFMCLSGTVEKDGTVKVSTLKDTSWWELASGAKCNSMAAQAQELCSADAPSSDVAQLQTFQSQDAIDYTNVPATLSACSLLELRNNHAALLGEATEHLYQLNHVYVPVPSKTDKILHDDRLFAVLDCWDYSKKLTLACRGKAMLQLAQIKETAEYKSAHAAGELRHPVLASLRVRVKRKEDGPSEDADGATQPSQTTASSAVSAIIVEAEPLQSQLTHEIPNDSVDAIHGLLAAGPTPTSERLAAAPLHTLAPSPFYNIVIDGEPSDKVVALLRFTQRSVGKQIANGFRLVTDNVQDACDPLDTHRYGTIVCCTVEKSPDFTAVKNSLVLAVICKVMAPSKPQHRADFYIEIMEPVANDCADKAIAMVQQLHRVATVNLSGLATSTEAVWQQRKCRRLARYPTQTQDLGTM